MRTLVAAIVLGLATPASAAPGDPVVLARGEVEGALVLGINLEPRLVARPLTLSPDAWIGLTDRWTVGVIHSASSVDRIDADASLCVRQYAPLCDRLYRGGGLDVRWSAVTGALAVAPRARLVLRDVSPIKPAVMVGALVQWTRGRYAISSDPYLRVGLANTDEGNRAALVLPLYLAIEPACRWLLALHTGWNSDLAVIRDGWHIPFALIVRAHATPTVDIGIEAGFTSLFGPQNTIKQRSALITLSVRSPRR